MIQIDMQMPNVCDDCPFMDEDHGDYPYCVALGQNRGYTFRIREKRFPNCPLKEQEAVEPSKDIVGNRRCPKCFTILEGKFCHKCGQAVKWE